MLGVSSLNARRARHDSPEWQATIEAPILIVGHGGPTMLARIGVMRALNRHAERVFNPTAKSIIGGGASWRDR
jgi:hypothetical protein